MVKGYNFLPASMEILRSPAIYNCIPSDCDDHMKRFEELIALVCDKDDFFKTREPSPVDSLKRKYYKAYDDAFMVLDDDSWDILKLKAVQHYLGVRQGQTKQGFFHHLNEAFAYKFLVEKGYQEVRFMKEGKKGPDLKYLDLETKYCEVKSIGLSDDEIAFRSMPTFNDGEARVRLSDEFMAILQKVTKKAMEQIEAVRGVGFAFVHVNFDDLTLDYVDTYREQLNQFCSENPYVAVKPGILDNDIIYSRELFK